MKITQVLVESAGATVAFAFGRFNPAHQGHIEVWRAVEEAGSNWFIGTNPSTLGPNDPLTFQQKSAWMEEIYPPITGHIVPEQSVLTLAAYIFKKLRKNENATVAYITDDTDWAWSGKLLNQYNGVEGAHGYYKFAQIIHVPSPRVSSATALRDAARADDKVAFYHASGTDPKSKVAGLTYFDTVKQACEKYPLPVKRGQKVKEAPDAKFLNFMNKSMSDRVDPVAQKSKTGDDWYDNAPTMNIDSGMASYRPALDFCVKIFQKLTPTQKTKLAIKGEEGVIDWLTAQATKQGFIPDQFVYEDIDEVQEFLPEIFKDPDITSWALLLTDGEPLPKAPSKGPFKIMMNKGFGPWKDDKGNSSTGGYRPADWVSVDVLDNISDAEQMLKGLITKNPSYYIGIVDATGNFQNFYDPKKVKENVEENMVPMSKFRPTMKQAGITTPRAPLWSFQEIAQKLGIPNATLNSWAFKIIGNFPEAIPGVKSHIGSTKYYNSNEIKRWVIDNNVRERIKSASSKVSEDEQKTVAKTWDQMTPKEKSSGVKGRTIWNEKTKKYYTVFDVPATVKEDDESSEVKQQGQLIPWPAGTAKVHVSDVYDWYKLGQVISDLDDADPAAFGQGAPQTVIAFGSEEEESKLMPMLKRLGLRIDDIDPAGADLDEACHAGELYEYLKKVHGKWALVSKSNPKKVLQYYRGGDEKPSDEWVNKVERRVHSFESKKK